MNIAAVLEGSHGADHISPMTMSVTGSEDFHVDSRFLELHEELRHVVFNGIASLSSTRWSSPDANPSAIASSIDDRTTANNNNSDLLEEQTLDFSAVTIPRSRLIRYLQNWVTECAPTLDKFDTNRHFQLQVPLIAQSSPAVLYAMLAFSARQMERRGILTGSSSCDSLELYQESIRRLSPSLQVKDPRILVAACILAVFELMSGRPTDWKRHLEGCAAFFDFFGVNGFSGGLAQAVFWCYARMELCGVIISDGTESTTLPISKWIPAPPPSSPEGGRRAQHDDLAFARGLFRDSCTPGSSSIPDIHANWAVYLCARVCDFRFRRTQYLELGVSPEHQDSRPFSEQWRELWTELRYWLDQRPAEMLPHVDRNPSPPAHGTNSHPQQRHLFPSILFSHWAAISSNQLYHTACILLLEMRPPGQELPAPESSAVWHARRVCGISCTNPHKGSLVNSIHPLYVAGRLFTHPSERLEIAKLLRSIDRDTGWGSWWRLKDLEAEWGCDYRGMSAAAAAAARSGTVASG